MRDKDVRGVCAALAPIAARIFAVRVDNPRSCSAEELAGTRGGPQQPRVEAVDPLQHEGVAGPELQLVALLRPAPPGHEVVARRPHHLAGQEPAHLILEPGQVERLQRLEVPLPLGVARGLLAVHVVVVEREGHRVHPVDLELHREPLDEGGLAGGGGPGCGRCASRGTPRPPG